eukprot:15365808-Ditylum_brightwellii.AAC.2
MLTAGVTYKSEFAKDIMGIFLKMDWPDKETWSKEKLWTGDIAVFQLGKCALAALRDARNMCNQQILLMLDIFLTLPAEGKTLVESKKAKLKMLRKFALHGRDEEEGIRGFLPVLAAFCLKKEDMPAQSYCAASNMVATKKGVLMDHLYKSPRGFTVEDKMGTAKFALIRTVIHNNLVGGIFDKEQEEIQPLQRNWNQST